MNFNIAGRAIGPGEPSYIVAEVSANHGQNFDEAVRIIQAAHQSGADAVKLQTYTPDTLTIQCDRDEFLIRGGTLWDGRTLYELYGEAYTPWEWQPKLMRVAADLGMPLFSTPFDPTAVDFLEAMSVPAHKIASFEIVDLPLIEKIAATGKPIIMSTGMATLREIEEAVAAIRGQGNHQIVLLKCTSQYPASPTDMHLRTIPHLAERFKVPVGLSDHTMGVAVPVAAAALGACMIEKHFTLSRNVPGPDSAFSLEPHEFAELVRAVRFAEQSLGEEYYGPTANERSSLRFRRSLYVVKDIQAGEPFTPDNVRSIRPSDGLPPKHLPQVLGRMARQTLTRGTPLTWEQIA